MVGNSLDQDHGNLEPPASRGEIAARIAVVGTISAVSMWLINQEASRDDSPTDVTPQQQITEISDNN